MATELRAALSLFEPAAQPNSEGAADADPAAAGRALSHCASTLALLVTNGEAPEWDSDGGKQLLTRLCAASFAVGLASSQRRAGFGALSRNNPIIFLCNIYVYISIHI